MDWGTIIAITVTGLVVVFLGLILLIIAISIMGAIMKATNKKIDKPSQTAPKPPVKPIVPAKPAAPVVQAGISGETVAAISAAVACAMDTDQPVAIKSIRKADTVTNRSVWRLAGITENTRPF
ncbi:MULTISPECIES: OadG family transporter subunit [Clostridiaceae]|uniref:OadG family protein n=1 Tax=Clostridium facile TaxID=2763035 RepID=A0ABR7IQU5_9CLOT|nr:MULTISPECIES: OadG family transporter subunit [Clostridiaceae]MBC5787531.1 OadG family protein [Clostridium facile]PWM98432.1 MAG: hypothetical protein DBX37_06885 [Massilioclostridium sp.]